MKKSLAVPAASFVLLAGLTGCATTTEDPIASSASASSSARTSESVEDQARDLFADWNETLATGDPAQVNEMYAEDAVLLPTLAPGVRDTSEEREEYFEGFLEGQPTGVIDELVARSTGPDSLVSSGLYIFTMAETGAVVPARFTYVYEYDGEEWLIVSHHSSRVPEAEGAGDDD